MINRKIAEFEQFKSHRWNYKQGKLVFYVYVSLGDMLISKLVGMGEEDCVITQKDKAIYEVSRLWKLQSKYVC